MVAINQLKLVETFLYRKSKPKNDAFEAIHSAAEGLHRAGIVDQATMREYDKLCLLDTHPKSIHGDNQ